MGARVQEMRAPVVPVLSMRSHMGMRIAPDALSIGSPTLAIHSQIAPILVNVVSGCSLLLSIDSKILLIST